MFRARIVRERTHPCRSLPPGSGPPPALHWPDSRGPIRPLREPPSSMIHPKTSTPAQAAPMPTQNLELGIPGFSFLDLHRPERLADLQRAFLGEVGRSNPELLARWERHASGAETLTGPA